MWVDRCYGRYMVVWMGGACAGGWLCRWWEIIVPVGWCVGGGCDERDMVVWMGGCDGREVDVMVGGYCANGLV